MTKVDMKPVYQSGKISLYRKLERPPIKWLVEDVIKEGGITILYGASGCMKSYASVDLACRIVNGMDFHGREVEQGNVIYIAAEAAVEAEERIEAWLSFHDKSARPLIFDQSIDLHSLKDMTSLRDIVRQVEAAEGKVSLIVIDGLSDCTAGVKLSDPDDVNTKLKPHLLSFVRETNVGLFILHHTGHSNDHERGAKVLRDMTDTTIKVTKEKNMFDITWKLEKVRRQNPDKMQDMHLHIEDVSESVGMDNVAVIQGGKWKHLANTKQSVEEAVEKPTKLTNSELLENFIMERGGEVEARTAYTELGWVRPNGKYNGSYSDALNGSNKIAKTTDGRLRIAMDGTEVAI